MTGAEIDVRRVSWRFWTWYIRIGDDVVIGAGSRAGAATAVDRFLSKHGAKDVTYERAEGERT